MFKRAIMAGLIVASFAGAAMASDSKPLQLALMDPFQMVPAGESITGLRLTLLYTRNQDVTGVSLTPGINRATGAVKGIEWGLANWTDGDVNGWQDGLLNRAGGRFVGLQSGLASVTEGDLTGIQSGFITWTEGFSHGWKMGAVNYTAGNFVGLETGFLNINRGPACGISLGVVNYSENTFKGMQWGFVNHAIDMKGFQLGFVNVATTLNGLQIGLGNYNGKKEPFEFLPIVNWSF